MNTQHHLCCPPCLRILMSSSTRRPPSPEVDPLRFGAGCARDWTGLPGGARRGRRRWRAPSSIILGADGPAGPGRLPARGAGATTRTTAPPPPCSAAHLTEVGWKVRSGRSGQVRQPGPVRGLPRLAAPGRAGAGRRRRPQPGRPGDLGRPGCRPPAACSWARPRRAAGTTGWPRPTRTTCPARRTCCSSSARSGAAPGTRRTPSPGSRCAAAPPGSHNAVLVAEAHVEHWLELAAARTSDYLRSPQVPERDLRGGHALGVASGLPRTLRLGQRDEHLRDGCSARPATSARPRPLFVALGPLRHRVAVDLPRRSGGHDPRTPLTRHRCRRSDSMIKHLDVDGVPTLLAPTTGPMHAGLVFRVGQADETLARKGITHLVEHLALHSHRRGRLPLQRRDRLGAHLLPHAGLRRQDRRLPDRRVRRPAIDLPMPRLETEKEILRTEQSSRPHRAPPSRCALWRHGARDFGLPATRSGACPRSPRTTCGRGWPATSPGTTRRSGSPATRCRPGLRLDLPAGVRRRRRAPSSALPVTPGLLPRLVGRWSPGTPSSAHERRRRGLRRRARTAHVPRSCARRPDCPIRSHTDYEPRGAAPR